MVTALVLLFIGVCNAVGIYPIAEPDAYDEFLKSEDKVVKAFERARKKIKHQIENMEGEKTTPAEKSYSYYIDPTYTLEFDIPIYDRNGNVVGILYPKGYRFNPLEYLKSPPEPMIVFNPCRKKEKQFVKKLLKRYRSAVLVASSCPIKKIKDEYGLPVYLLLKDLKEKFRIEHTVSVIKADMEKKLLEVTVISVK